MMILLQTSRRALLLRLLHQQQQRHYWQEIVRCKPNPQTGKLEYEKPSQAGMRAVQGMANDDEKRQKKMVNYQEYEKPWMKRQRLKSSRIYGRKKKQVVELTKYVKFMRDYKQNQE